MYSASTTKSFFIASEGIKRFPSTSVTRTLNYNKYMNEIGKQKQIIVGFLCR